jgi:hypothetical protein
MNKALLLIILLAFSVQYYCINHMDLLTTMTGEHNLANMGWSMASLDFNYDSYDDLIVCSNIWGADQPPDSIAYGRIYFYWGGPGFDNVADYMFTGSYESEFRSTLCNLGDVNGDGIEDLGMTHYGIPIGLHINNYKFSIFYGGSTPQPQPDFSILYYSITASALGDINGDGFDDIGLQLSKSTPPRTLSFHVIYGGSLQDVELFELGYPSYSHFFNGIGDVNNDGYDDLAVGYYDQSPSFNARLYFGGPQFDIQNYIVLYNNPTYIVPYSVGVGDVNGDSIDDFIGYAYTPDASLYFWFGNNIITPNHDVSLTPYNPGAYGYGITSGDVNNDGYNDIFGTNPISNWNNGRAGLWLGRQQFNGTLDLTFDAPSETNECNFGDASAAGDYNGDGFCDYAVAAPTTELTWFPWNGKVYVYAGNAELADTTVGNEDEVLPEPSGLWSVKLSPNPLMGRQDILTLKLSGQGYKDLSRAEVTLSNIKGQVINIVALTAAELQTGSVILTPGALPSGLYLLSVRQGNSILVTTKLSVIR